MCWVEKYPVFYYNKAIMKKPVIFLSGGGTMGSVTPLVALWERLRGDFECIWIGSRKGVERGYIGGLGMPYVSIPAGKFRHYLSIKTLLAPFFILAGLIASVGLTLAYRPKAIVVSGSFVSVPLVWAGYLGGIPIIAHQEDLKIGLAGRLTIPFASAVTAAFPETLKEIKNKNKSCIGNPVREIFRNPKTEKWQGDLPMVLILGGGLGSEKINRAIAEIAPELAGKARVLHLTGKNKTIGVAKPDKNYERFEGLWGEDLAGAMAAADIVVSRAGLSTLGELSALGKATILIPLPGVGQENNAEYFEKRGAAIVISQDDADGLLEKIKILLRDDEKRKALGENIKKIFPGRAEEKMENLLKKLLR